MSALSDKVTDQQVYEMYEVICVGYADIEASIQVADQLGWTEEEVQDAINRHRETLGKSAIAWEEDEEEFPSGEEPEEPLTDKVINDMVVYGKILADLTIEQAITKAAEHLNMSKRDVADAIDRHERSHRK